MKKWKITKSRIGKPIICALGLLFFMQTAFSQNFEGDVKAFRDKYKADFIKDQRSPLKLEDLQYLDFYSPNKEYRVLCKFKATGNGEPFELPTSSGETKTYVVFGQLTFKIDKKRYKLNVYRSLALVQNPLYKDYLFIPFKDLTNGKETYGGGRYIDLRMKELDGDIWLDFNKAYNPYCAFSVGYSCPIPPKENHLNVSIKAGEKNFKKETHHD